jgi:hypothetical protein
LLAHFAGQRDHHDGPSRSHIDSLLVVEALHDAVRPTVSPLRVQHGVFMRQWRSKQQQQQTNSVASTSFRASGVAFPQLPVDSLSLAVDRAVHPATRTAMESADATNDEATDAMAPDLQREEFLWAASQRQSSRLTGTAKLRRSNLDALARLFFGGLREVSAPLVSLS